MILFGLWTSFLIALPTQAHMLTQSEGVSSWSENKVESATQVSTAVWFSESEMSCLLVYQRPFHTFSFHTSSFPSPWIPYIPGVILVLVFHFESYCFYQEFPSPLPGRNDPPRTSVWSQGHRKERVPRATWKRAYHFLRKHTFPTGVSESQPNLYSSQKPSSGKAWHPSQGVRHARLCFPSLSLSK